MARHLCSAFTLAQHLAAGPSCLRPVLLRSPRQQYVAIPSQRRAASSFLGRIGNLLPSWVVDQRKAERLKTSETSPAVTEASDPPHEETGGIFDEVAKAEAKRRRKKYTEHKYRSGIHHISPRKLNDLSRQIAGLPVDEAIVQMQFSEKRASRWIKSTLALAKDHAIDYKGLEESKLVVSESWISKAPFGPKRVDIKARGRRGIKRKPYASLTVLLKEGQTAERKMEIKFKKELGKVRSAGMVREDGKLRRKVISDWTW